MSVPVGPFIANMTVEGPVATGNPGGNPLLIGGLNSNSSVQPLSISGSGVMKFTAGGAGAAQSIKSWSSSGGASISTGLTVISYTVTTGKTLYITDIDVSTDDSSPVLAQLKAGSTVVAERFISTTNSWSSIGIESQPTVGSGVVLTLVLAAASGKNAAYYVGGFEQ